MPKSVLALDVGEKRVGVAIANQEIRLARPLITLLHDAHFWDKLAALIEEYNVVAIAVGLPRGLDGQETAQTRYTASFISELRGRFDGPVQAQDEATTSVKAEVELRARGKPYEKSDIDALAATYILEDYLGEVGNV